MQFYERMVITCMAQQVVRLMGEGFPLTDP